MKYKSQARDQAGGGPSTGRHGIGVVERARRGDIRAYEELVRQYQDVAFRLAYTILGSAEEAEDAAQEGSFAPTTR